MIAITQEGDEALATTEQAEPVEVSVRASRHAPPTSYESLFPKVSQAFDEAMREVYQDYYAAGTSRYLPTPRGINPLGSNADYHYRNETDYMRMLERARKFDRDNMVVGQGVNKLVANVLQEGLTLDPESGDDALDTDLKQRWEAEAEDPAANDYEGERVWRELEALVLRNVIVDGDLVKLPIAANGTFQFVENHRLRNPFNRTQSIVHGVELDSGRRRVALHLTEDNIDPLRSLTRANRSRRVAIYGDDGRRQAWHLFMPKRFSQTRGVTAFAPSVIPISYHDDLQFANMVKAKVASFYAIFREIAVDAMPGAPSQIGNRTTQTQADGSIRVLQEGSPGIELIGKPGEKLQGFAPNVPNPEFFQHASIILQIIAINLDLPLQVFLSDPSKTNFSGWRGAIDQARMRFKAIQMWLRSHFHIPCYRFKVQYWLQQDAALRRAAARSNVDILKHTWHLPVPSYIEPMKDVAADDLECTRNLTSYRRRAARRGLDFKTIAKEIPADRALIVENAFLEAERLNKSYPDLKIDWRELAYGHSTTGIKYVFGADLGDSDSDQTANPNKGSNDEA